VAGFVSVGIRASGMEYEHAELPGDAVVLEPRRDLARYSIGPTEARRERPTSLALVQTICKRTTRPSAAQDGARRHEARTGRHETTPDGTDGTSPPDS